MDWKRPYCLHSDVTGYPCYGARQVYGLYSWYISLLLQPTNYYLLFTAVLVTTYTNWRLYWVGTLASTLQQLKEIWAKKIKYGVQNRCAIFLKK